MWSALLSVALAAPVAFRGDGTATYPGPPPELGAAPAFRVPLPAWSNAGVVRVGEAWCGTAEPTTTWCADAGTGAVRWTASSDYLDTLPADARPAFLAQRAAARDAASRLAALQGEASAVRREMRRHPEDATLPDRLADLTRGVVEAQQLVEAQALFDTDAVRDIIGYASATPVTDGSHVYAVFGNGVVSSFTARGERRWSVWLGPADPVMRGHNVGTSASPLLVDGLLVVPHRRLVALDPATGAVRWTAGPWRDYGSPAVVRLGDTNVLVTPAGEAVRARDGRVLATGLGDVWFTTPVVQGDVVHWVGGWSDPHVANMRPIRADAVRLRLDGDRVIGTRLWSAEIPSRTAVYATPVRFGGRLWVVDRELVLWTLDEQDGTVARVADLRPPEGGTAYASPAVVGDRLVLVSDKGLALRLTEAGVVDARASVGPTRASPAAHDGRTVFRTFDALVALPGPR